MSFQKTIIVGFLSIFFISLNAQIGGDNTYEFLNLSNSARITGLGGMNDAIVDEDVNLVYQNPSLLNAEMDNQFSVSAMSYIADISYGYVGYAKHFDSLMTVGIGVQFVNYGRFTATNANAQTLGTFNGTETSINLSAARTWKKFNYGVTLKGIFSSIEAYSSFGLAADAGITYFDSESDFSVSLVGKNIGGQITTYTPNNREPIPFDLQFGVSKKLKYVPFRISVTAHNLHRFDIRYDDPNQQEDLSIFGEENTDDKNYFGNKLMRHFVFGGELYLGKNMTIRAGYNFLRQQELALKDVRSLVGFSFGVGIKIKRFRIDYGRARYHQAAAVNHFTISTNFNEFIKK